MVFTGRTSLISIMKCIALSGNFGPALSVTYCTSIGRYLYQTMRICGSNLIPAIASIAFLCMNICFEYQK